MVYEAEVHDDPSASKYSDVFVKLCVAFTTRVWPHADRLDLPDAGFESGFRATCVQKLNGWQVSSEREMRFGYGIDSASGVEHEIDVVVMHEKVTGIAEMKHRLDAPVQKNDVISFFAKIVDYLAHNPFLLHKDMAPVFLTTLRFEESALAACLGLGIHPVAPNIRPMPVLLANRRIMNRQVDGGLIIADDINERLRDFAVRVDSLARDLSETWVRSRFIHLSDSQIGVLSRPYLPVYELADELSGASSECAALLEAFIAAKNSQ
jgi:hypothetical protein